MKDPLDQWAEGGTPAASQGDSPGRGAKSAGKRRDRARKGANAKGSKDTKGRTEAEKPVAISRPVNVVGPTRHIETGVPRPPQPRPQQDPTPQQRSGAWDGFRTVPGEVAHSSTPAPAQAPASPPAPAAGPAGPGGGDRLPGEEFASYLQAPVPKRHPKRRRPLRRTAVALLAMILVGSAGTFAWAETRLQRDVDLNHFASRPSPGPGTTYLIVGSDSREGLSEADRKELHTGVFGGRRTDSMILMHKGTHGTTMVSLPRDSWVTIPGYTRPSTGKRSGPVKNKLNAAFSQGGPELLISTIEQNTGLRIDHYAEIGFAGFVNIVDAVGGVPMCIERDIKDEDSGADLRKGCQNLDGAQALAFVRQRHQEAQGDLGRTQNQQKFLSALAKKAVAPKTVLDPSDLYPALSAGLDNLVVDQDMSMTALTKMFRSVQGVTGGEGEGKQVNVPTAGGLSTSKGSAVRWDKQQADQLFTQLKNDRPVTIAQK